MCKSSGQKSIFSKKNEILQEKTYTNFFVNKINI